MSSQFRRTAITNLPGITLVYYMPLKSALGIVQWLVRGKGQAVGWTITNVSLVLMCFLWGFSPRFDWAGPCFTIEAEQGCRWNWPRSATFITFVKTDCKNSRKLDPSSALLPSYASGFPSTFTGTVHQRPVKHLPYLCCLHSGSKVSTYQHVSIAETILKNSLTPEVWGKPH